MRSLATIDYKDWGHRLIDRLVELGIPRNTVYKRLGRRIHKNPHFGPANDDLQLRMMVNALNRMVEERQAELVRASLPKKEIKKKKHAQYKKEIFTDRELLREVGRRNTFNVMSWHQRWRYYVMSSLSTARSKKIDSRRWVRNLVRTLRTTAHASFPTSRTLSR